MKLWLFCYFQERIDNIQDKGINEIELERNFEYKVGDLTLIAAAHYTENGEDCYEKITRLLTEEIQRKSQ